MTTSGSSGRVRPYKIHVPEEEINRLNTKLALATFPTSYDNIDIDDENDSNDSSWKLGPPVREVQRLASVWQNNFSWRDVEHNLNQLPHFTASVHISGFDSPLNIHHIHAKSLADPKSKRNPIPLLFLHGWPGSFLEVTKLLDKLTVNTTTAKGDCNDVKFHVVAPSLLDFGFSSATKTDLFDIEDHADAYNALMKLLGYEKYVVQAGDVGCVIARYMTRKFPLSCRALHTNTILPAEPTEERYPELMAQLRASPISQAELQRLAQTGQHMEDNMAYLRQMSTKPLTLGYSLSDSPVGLLAWIFEKLHAWSDGYDWTDEEILTWVSVYAFSTAGPDASSKVYRMIEHTRAGVPAFASIATYIDVPLGVSMFCGDVLRFPRLWNRTWGPIVYEAEHERGGHFGAWERPDAIARDLKMMFAGSDYLS